MHSCGEYGMSPSSFGYELTLTWPWQRHQRLGLGLRRALQNSGLFHGSSSDHHPSVACRADKASVVHAGVGKVSFSEDALLRNAGALAAAILAARPKGVKGGQGEGKCIEGNPPCLLMKIRRASRLKIPRCIMSTCP